MVDACEQEDKTEALKKGVDDVPQDLVRDAIELFELMVTLTAAAICVCQITVAWAGY